MPDYAAFFLSSRQDVVQLELVEITHPSFSQPYRFVRNHADGVTVDLSEAEQGVEFAYYPARVTLRGSRDDLDSQLRIDLGDLGELIPAELDRVAAQNAHSIKPALRYWAFRSDDLTEPLFGPLELETGAVTSIEGGSSMDCRAPATNLTRTGERYKLDRFTTLRGFL